MMEEKIGVSGFVFIELFDRDGNLKETRDFKNTFTNAGKRYMTDLLCKTAPGTMKYIGIGTGSQAAASSDAALQTAVGTRGSGTVTDSGKTYQVQYTFASGNPASGPNAIKEAGLFSTTSGGCIGSRQVFSVINKATSDSLRITWRWVFS